MEETPFMDKEEVVNPHQLLPVNLTKKKGRPGDEVLSAASRNWSPSAKSNKALVFLQLVVWFLSLTVVTLDVSAKIAA